MSESLISSAEAPEAEAPQAEAPQAEAPLSSRPEWLPEKYKTPEDLAKGYKELESKFGQKEEDLRNRIIQELEEKAFSDRPADKGDYQLPETIDQEAAIDNELLSWWAEHSFENGFSQAEFEKGIEMYAKAVQGSMPDLEAEAKKLGDNASARIQSASAFANKFFPEAALPAIERMCESHEGIIALEAIMEAVRDGGYSDETSSPDRISESSLREMMQDERYWNPVKRDAAYIRKVQEGFEKLYAR
jgi:hypothetical protein